MQNRKPAVLERATREPSNSHCSAPQPKAQPDQNNWSKAVKWHLVRGIKTVPVAHRGKRPIGTDWEKTTDPLATFQMRVPAGEPCNVGILLGTTSSVVDVDLDSDTARDLAPHFLPKTEYQWGRKGNPRSHYLYRCNAESLKTTQFKRPDGSMVVELRGDGAQSVIPPSIHTSGEPIEYVSQGDPAEVFYEALQKAVGRVAAATLLVENYARTGGRNSYVLAVSGLLAHGGWTLEDAQEFVGTVVMRAGDDEFDNRMATVRATFAKHAAGEPVTGQPALAESIGEDVVKLVVKWLGIRCFGSSSQKPDATGRKSTSDQLVDSLPDAHLFHCPTGVAYATVSDGSDREALRIESERFRKYLAKRFYTENRRPPTDQSLREAISIYAAKAEFDGPQEDVYVRYAFRDGKMYVDLANSECSCIEITPDGWSACTNPPVQFTRPAGTKALSVPTHGGSFADLKQFVNMSEADWPLFAGYCLGAVTSEGPFPILMLQGEQGSAKTTTLRILSELIDPRSAGIRSDFRRLEDLPIAAANCHLLQMDNLSFIRDDMSDTLCRLSTGGGIGTRKLYSDSDQLLLDLVKPVVLNGICELAMRPDLLDRSIAVTLPRISESKRRSERELFEEFRQAAPRIQGALYDAVAASLKGSSNVVLERNPRLIDFARGVVAAESALGLQEGDFMAAYGENRDSIHLLALDSSPIFEALEGLLWNIFDHGNRHWEGTATSLFRELNRNIESRPYSSSWPSTAAQLSNRLHRMSSNFGHVGIAVTFSRNRDERLIRFEMTDKYVTRIDNVRFARCKRHDGAKPKCTPEQKYG